MDFFKVTVKAFVSIFCTAIAAGRGIQFLWRRDCRDGGDGYELALLAGDRELSVTAAATN